MNVVDQPQERAETCLKDHGSVVDCTHCLMPTKIRKESLDTQNKAGKRLRSIQQLQSQAVISPSTPEAERAHSGLDFETQIRQIQLDPAPSVSRDVYSAVSFQLTVATSRHLSNAGFPKAESENLRSSRRHLDAKSLHCRFPLYLLRLPDGQRSS